MAVQPLRHGNAVWDVLQTRNTQLLCYHTPHDHFRDVHPIQCEEWPGTTLLSARKRKQFSRNTAIFFFTVVLQIIINEEAGLLKILSFLQVKNQRILSACRK